MAELNIGFDLGTSTTKVVVRDLAGGTVYQIPIGDGGSSYVLPSVVYYNPESEQFTLEPHGDNEWQLTGIKQELIRALAPHAEITASAFIACVMKRVMDWLLRDNNETRLTYGEVAKKALHQGQSFWFGNIGVPMDVKDPKLTDAVKRRFSGVLQAGVALAWENVEVTKESVVHALQDVYTAPAASMYHRCFSAVPEVLGLAAEFKESPFGNSQVIAFVDVGAATVDLAVLNMVYSDEMRYNLYFSGVTEYGCYVIAHKVFDDRGEDFSRWLDSIGGIGAIFPPEILTIRSREIEDEGDGREETGFKFHTAMGSMYAKGIQKLKYSDPLDSWKWRELGVSTYFTGGGRMFRCYSDQIDVKNRDMSGYVAHGYTLKPFPHSNKFPEYERTCVAHGLSRAALDYEGLNVIVGPPKGADDYEGTRADFGLPWYDKDAR